MRSKSTQVMDKIVAFIDEFYFVNNVVPTMQEISEKVGIAKSNVCRYLQEMAARGMIDSGGGWRGTKTHAIAKVSGVCRVPVVGEIACGTPMLAEENIQGYLLLSETLLGQGNHFALRAKGDSMLNAGICNGDVVIVKQQDYAEDGQIVVALIDDSATLKRYYRDEKLKLFRLHPENDLMQDMYYKEVNVQGVVKKVIKDVE